MIANSAMRYAMNTKAQRNHQITSQKLFQKFICSLPIESSAPQRAPLSRTYRVA